MATTFFRPEGIWKSTRLLQLRLHRYASTISGPSPRLGTTASGAATGIPADTSENGTQNHDGLYKSLSFLQDVFRQGTDSSDWNFSRPSSYGALSEAEAAGESGLEVPLDQLPPDIQKFIANLRVGDVRTAVLEAQKDGIFLDPAPWVSIYQPAFSAMLRCLDPFKIGPLVDPAHGIDIPPSALQDVAFDEIIEPSGMRRIYALLFRIVQWMFAIRIAAGSRPAHSDWEYLMRLAGTTSDRRIARRIWSASALTLRGPGIDARNSSNYAEFIRSRFQTVPLYTQFRIHKSRVSIFNIGFKSDIVMSNARRGLLYAMRLRKLRAACRSNPNLHIDEVLGSDNAGYSSEWFDDLFRIISTRGLAVNEDIVCTCMAAFASMGSLQMVKKILADIWHVDIHVDKETKNVTVEGGRSFPESHPLFPSKNLLDTVVLAFGSNAEIQTSIKLADFLSTHYNIPIPHNVWTAMLTWTHITASHQVSREWKLSGFLDKLVNPHAIKMVWDTMISDPYNIKPSFHDYDILIRFFISKGRAKEAARHIYDARRLHWLKQEEQFRDAEEGYLLALQTGASTDRHALRYERALVLRAVMHWKFGSWMAGLTSRTQQTGDDDDFIIRYYPRMLLDFELFIRLPITYKTFNGVVCLREKAVKHGTKTVEFTSEAASALDQALNLCPPSNFASKRWYRQLLEYKARYFGLRYPGTTYGPERRGLGRPLLRRSKFPGKTVVIRQAVGPDEHQYIRRRVSNSWHTVDLHFSRPRSKHNITHLIRVPQSKLRSLSPDLGASLCGQFNDDALLLPPKGRLSKRDGSRVPTLDTIFSGLMRRGRKNVSKEASTKWKETGLDFIHALHPGIMDEEAWKYSTKLWPNTVGDGLSRLRRARRVRIYVNNRRTAPEDLEEKFPLVEQVQAPTIGRNVLIKKYAVSGFPQVRPEWDPRPIHSSGVVKKHIVGGFPGPDLEQKSKPEPGHDGSVLIKKEFARNSRPVVRKAPHKHGGFFRVLWEVQEAKEKASRGD